MTESERWFEAYLSAGGRYTCQHEADLGIGSRPDYLIRRGADEALCELKEFGAPPTWLQRLVASENKVGSASMRLALNNTRRRIGAAAKQLNAAKGLGLPLIIVLADPEGFGHQLGTDELIWAMYGDPEIHVSVGRGGPVSEARYTLARDGSLRGQNSNISAVATLHRGDSAAESLSSEVKRRVAEELPATATRDQRALRYLELDEELASDYPAAPYYRVRLFHTLGATQYGTAVAVPSALFDGPHDESWCADDTGRFVRIRP
jgi:hypothetical protein